MADIELPPGEPRTYRFNPESQLLDVPGSPHSQSHRYFLAQEWLELANRAESFGAESGEIPFSNIVSAIRFRTRKRRCGLSGPAWSLAEILTAAGGSVIEADKRKAPVAGLNSRLLGVVPARGNLGNKSARAPCPPSEKMSY